jgi:hypothetical protein
LLDITPLHAVLSIEDGLAAATLLHGDDNIFASYEIRKGGDIDAAMASADLIIEGTYRTPAQEQMYIEPQGMLSYWDDSGRCHVIGSMQCPYYIHKAMKVLLGAGDHDVVVQQSVTGGGFGGKEEYPSMIAAHAALLARKAGRPVKLIYDRDEDIAATTKRHPAVIRHRLGVKSDGTIAAIDIDVIMDAGAYLTLSPVVLSRGVLHAAGPYRCDTIRVRGRSVATNTPPHGAFRGFGAPQTTFAYERQITKAARRLGMSQLDFRRKNMLVLGDTTATGQTLSYSVGTRAVLDAVAGARGRPGIGPAGCGAVAVWRSTITAPDSRAAARSAWPDRPPWLCSRTARSRFVRAPPTSARARSRSSRRSRPRPWAWICRGCPSPSRARRWCRTAGPRWPRAPAWWWAWCSRTRPGRCDSASRPGRPSAVWRARPWPSWPRAWPPSLAPR